MTSEEGEIIKVHSDYREKDLKECSLSLIGRFLTTKPINSRAAKSLLRSVWKFGQDLRISDVGDGSNLSSLWTVRLNGFLTMVLGVLMVIFYYSVDGREG